MEKVLKFSNPRDRRTGFLSNESRHSFVIDGVRWPTVEHYIQAKKFEGTQIEDRIRQAPTVFQAKRLARARKRLEFDPQRKRFIRESVYGKDKDNVYFIRKDWNTAKPRLLKAAIGAKFGQNSKLRNRLLGTRDGGLVDVREPLTGPILERIRKGYQRKNKRSNATILKFHFGSLKDLRTSRLTKAEDRMVRVIIFLSLKIAKLEGWNKVFPEMVEDAILHILEKKKTKRQGVKEYISKLRKVPWTIVYCRLPNYEKLIHVIHKQFIKKDPSQKKQTTHSTIIAGFIMWLRSHPTQRHIIKEITKRTKRPKKIQVELSPEKRNYRGRLPPKLKVREGVPPPRPRPPPKQRIFKPTPVSPKKIDLLAISPPEIRDVGVEVIRPLSRPQNLLSFSKTQFKIPEKFQSIVTEKLSLVSREEKEGILEEWKYLKNENEICCAIEEWLSYCDEF